jgi:hypothetical protein
VLIYSRKSILNKYGDENIAYYFDELKRGYTTTVGDFRPTEVGIFQKIDDNRSYFTR